MTEKTACRTPAKGVPTNIPTWKFDACRRALLIVLEGGDALAMDIAVAAGVHLTEDERAKLGSLGWHMTTVRLEMEMRGEIARVDGKKPLTLRRKGS